jgi:hypothetical protein
VRYCPACGADLEDAERAARQEHYGKLFALQDEARALGRNIMSGGGYRDSPYHGAVVATTYPYPSALGSRSNNDSWHCHHQHPDDLAAEACALEEVRRLAAGGEYRPCSDYPGCQDEECRRFWPRELREAS